MASQPLTNADIKLLQSPPSFSNRREVYYTSCWPCLRHGCSQAHPLTFSTAISLLGALPPNPHCSHAQSHYSISLLTSSRHFISLLTSSHHSISLLTSSHHFISLLTLSRHSISLLTLSRHSISLLTQFHHPIHLLTSSCHPIHLLSLSCYHISLLLFFYHPII